MDLMYCQPEADEDGEVRAKPQFGGRRRIDRILYDKNHKVKVAGYQFLTCLAGQTDHVPVGMTLELN
jgi:sphingomyelin phosphodiesterase 3